MTRKFDAMITNTPYIETPRPFRFTSALSGGAFLRLESGELQRRLDEGSRSGAQPESFNMMPRERG